MVTIVWSVVFGMWQYDFLGWQFLGSTLEPLILIGEFWISEYFLLE